MPPCLLIHGGAGAMDRLNYIGEARYRDGLRRSAEAGIEALEAGASALDMVSAAVRSMEQHGAFNAGTGACLSLTGQVELDAAVMRGSDLGIGAVAGVGPIVDPIGAALAVLDRSPHVLLCGEGATAFAGEHGIGLMDPPASPERLEEWTRRRSALDDTVPDTDRLTAMSSATGERGHDTVGAVAVDRHGNTSVAVSTGGIWLKQPGRVGDSPLPGTGFWAEDGVGAVCATGTGELIIRSALVRRALDALERGRSATEACREALGYLEARFGKRTAGLIAIDAAGRPGLAFNTAGMGSALVADGVLEVAIFPGESSLQTESAQ